jgi:hypothetical protein
MAQQVHKTDQEVLDVLGLGGGRETGSHVAAPSFIQKICLYNDSKSLILFIQP